eukprot:gene10929-17043_t
MNSLKRRYSLRQKMLMKRNVEEMIIAASSLCDMHKGHQATHPPPHKRMMYSLNNGTLVDCKTTQATPPPFVRDGLQDACQLFIHFLASFTEAPPPSHVVTEVPNRSPLHESFLTSCTEAPPPSHVVTEVPTRSPLHESFLTSCTEALPPSHVVTEVLTRSPLHGTEPSRHRAFTAQRLHGTAPSRHSAFTA